MTKTTKFLIVLSILSIVGTALVYQFLPATIPTHFGFDGHPDAFNNKSQIFLTGALPILLVLLMSWFPTIDPKRENYKKFSGAYEILKVAIVVFLITIQWLVILYTLGHIQNISTVMVLLLSILFIVLGNYMPKFKHNYFVGIKTPWTLASPVSWQKTHRLGGYLFMASGALSIVTLLILPKYASVILIGSLLLAALIVTVYSYIVFKKTTDNR